MKKKQEAKAGHEIPRNQWVKFFDRFSHEHEGWPVEVEIKEKGRRSDVEARKMPLQGISVDLKPGAKDTTSIMLDVRPTVHLTHIVPRTKQVVLDEDHQQIEVLSATGDKTIVHFQSP